MYHFAEIDKLIIKVDNFKIDPAFSEEKTKREKNVYTKNLSNQELLRLFAHLIAYSQNANSKIVDYIIKSGKFDTAFYNFDINRLVKINSSDIINLSWDSIKGIRFKKKVGQIIKLAIKLQTIDNLLFLLYNNSIPKKIESISDIEMFWSGFNELQRVLKIHDIPFFKSTTSLLHFLMESGYDCVKPDLVVMNVGKKLNFVENVKSESGFKTVVKIIQEYSVARKVRPSIVDLYFLIDGGQIWARQFVKSEFYDN